MLEHLSVIPDPFANGDYVNDIELNLIQVIERNVWTLKCVHITVPSLNGGIPFTPLSESLLEALKVIKYLSELSLNAIEVEGVDDWPDPDEKTWAIAFPHLKKLTLIGMIKEDAIAFLRLAPPNCLLK